MFDEPMSHRLFEGLSDVAMLKLKKMVNIVHYQSGDYLIHENKANDLLFLVLDGSVNIESNAGEHIAVLGEGSVLGEISSTGISLPIANAVAANAVQVMTFPMQVIREIAEQEPAFSKALYELGMERVMTRFLDGLE